MTFHIDSPTTRSEKLFSEAFSIAVQGRHRDSDALLEMAHDMRAMEMRIEHIAQHAPSELAVLLLKEAMTGFSDEADPAEYIQTNREPIRFYASNDAQLRSLINATFNPVPYERDQIALTDAELENARQVMANRDAEDPGRITDPTITPAAIAIQARGFTGFTNNGGCSLLRQCPDCKNKYSTKVHAQRRIYWHCPHCNIAKEA